MRKTILILIIIFILMEAINLFAISSDISSIIIGLKALSYDEYHSTVEELNKISFDLIVEHLLKCIEKGEDDDLAIKILLYLDEREPAKSEKIIMNLLKNENAKIRAASLALIKGKYINKKFKKELLLFLNDNSFIVRLYAVEVLEGIVPDKILLPIVISSLSSDEYEAQPFGDPPYPASIMAKNMLVNWDNKEKTIDYIKKYTTENKKIKYHLFDIVAFLTGKIEKPIYYYIGDPTPEDIPILEKYSW